MTVGELKERLDGYDDDNEVRIVLQRSYPLESEVAGVTSRRECDDQRPCENDDCDGLLDEHGTCLRCGEEYEVEGGPDVVFIAEGRQVGYGDERAWSGPV